MHSRVIIHKVKYFRETFQLCIPFAGLIESKVITEREKHVIVLEELGFTTQLIEQITRPQRKTNIVNRLARLFLQCRVTTPQTL